MLTNKNTIFTKNVDIKGMISTIIVTLKTSDGKAKWMGLNCLQFKGSTDFMKPSKEKYTNLTSEDSIKLDTIHAPVRSKPIGTSNPYRNIATAKRVDLQFGNRQKRA